MLSNNFQTLEELAPMAGKCPRCSLCKFPPLASTEHAEHSAICPSYEEFKVHASSGGGLLVMAMSILEGRSKVTPSVQKLVYGCTACGGCDVACKYSADIEVLEIIWQLRAKVFSEIGPLAAHAEILDAIEHRGHPFAHATEERGAWQRAISLPTARSSRDTLLWVGPHYGLEAGRWRTLRHALELMADGQKKYQVLGVDEPYTGRAALEIGDRPLFQRCAEATARAIRSSGAKEVVCLSAEDYSTLRSLTPRYASIDVPIRHVTEVYDELLREKKLKPGVLPRRKVAWHDPSYLGRLSAPFRSWTGERKKVLRQLMVYDPPRPVNYGAGGCYEPPRSVIRSMAGLDLIEFFRRKEYAFDSGEGGQAFAVAPQFAVNTAKRRLREAVEVGAELVVTECPQSLAMLESALASGDKARLRVTALTDLLFDSVRSRS